MSIDLFCFMMLDEESSAWRKIPNDLRGFGWFLGHGDAPSSSGQRDIRPNRKAQKLSMARGTFVGVRDKKSKAPKKVATKKFPSIKKARRKPCA